MLKDQLFLLVFRNQILLVNFVLRYFPSLFKISAQNSSLKSCEYSFSASLIILDAVLCILSQRRRETALLPIIEMIFNDIYNLSDLSFHSQYKNNHVFVTMNF